MTDRDSHLYMVVPVFNEVDNLERLFGSFRVVSRELGDLYFVHLLLVDDGSSDGTAEHAERLANGQDLVVLRSPENHGPGDAFARAFEYLAPRLTERDWVVTLEGDNTSRRELIRQMLQRTQEGYDVVLASPYMYGGGITNTSTLRVFMSHMANALVKELLGVRGILTMSSFFRLYRAPVLTRLQAYYGPRVVERAGFECMVELLLKMTYLGVSISEVPMLLDTSQRVGKSKMKILRTIAGYLALARRTGAWRRTAQGPAAAAYMLQRPA
jgi:dolichol-phosphate mannosyltransferase